MGTKRADADRGPCIHPTASTRDNGTQGNADTCRFLDSRQCTLLYLAHHQPTAMEDVDLVHKPGQHPLLPVPKELHVRPSVANVQAAEILKQMMEDAPAAEDQVLDISAGVQASPRKPTVLASSPAAGISAAEQTAFRNPPEAIPAMKAESRINLPPFPSVR